MVATLALLIAIQAQPDPDLSWLAGYWLSCDDGREVSETWSDPRAGVLANTTLTITAGRLSVETATIAPEAAGLTFRARPDGQPPADFVLSEATGTRVVFANPAHDFPQRVIYERVRAEDGGEVLSARIEGRIDDRDRAVAWTYRRADLNARCPL